MSPLAIPTPSLIIDETALLANIRTMADALPGARLRPHVKAHKCTGIAKKQYAAGHHGFTCATIREVEGMVAAGLADDLLLANEVVDMTRLGPLVAQGARITVAVDSPAIIDAAVAGGVREVVIDVNVGLPRCGCAPEAAGQLADLARSKGLEVRGVMGYEGHLMMVHDPDKKAQRTQRSMELLLQAHADVGGDLVTAGGTGTYSANTWANEIQAGSYALMDSQYAELEYPFVQALWVLGTVISSSESHAVANAGLKAMSTDHGNPAIEGAQVLFVSDEHVTFVPQQPVAVGDQVRITPSHIDPTMASHGSAHIIRDGVVIDEWPIDLRGW